MTTTTISAPQMASDPENCVDRQAKLYEAIRERISQSFFSRIRIDEEELLHVLFVKLVDKFLPPFGSEELIEFLNQAIADMIREFKLGVRSTVDIDDVDPDEGPSYDERINADEVEFEKMFDRFCDSRDEPERTIFRKFRTYARQDIAKLVKISRNDVAKLIKSMPKKFEKFVLNFRE